MMKRRTGWGSASARAERVVATGTEATPQKVKGAVTEKRDEKY